jgi:hypothetical protein
MVGTTVHAKEIIDSAEISKQDAKLLLNREETRLVQTNPIISSRCFDDRLCEKRFESLHRISFKSYT